MTRERDNRTPYLIGSLVFHAAVVGSMFIAWPHTAKPVRIVATPVTVVAEGPTNVRPAVQAPEEAPARTETPIPDATPEPAAPPAPEPEPAPPPKPSPPQPQPKPAPAPPKPVAAKPTPAPPPKPSPKPTPVPPKPAPPQPAKPAPAKPAPPAKDSFDLDALAASIKPGKKPAGRPASSAQSGPSRPETAVQARPAAGAATGLSASALSGLAAELQRRWNPNCEVEGGSDVNVKVAFTVAAGGRLIGQPQAVGANLSDSVVAAAADRAVRAVHQAAPFDTLPAELYGQKIAVNFNARKACASR